MDELIRQSLRLCTDFISIAFESPGIAQEKRLCPVKEATQPSKLCPDLQRGTFWWQKKSTTFAYFCKSWLSSALGEPRRAQMIPINPSKCCPLCKQNPTNTRIVHWNTTRVHQITRAFACNKYKTAFHTAQMIPHNAQVIHCCAMEVRQNDVLGPCGGAQKPFQMHFRMRKLSSWLTLGGCSLVQVVLFLFLLLFFRLCAPNSIK